jgi:hypothetical protein
MLDDFASSSFVNACLDLLQMPLLEVEIIRYRFVQQILAAWSRATA